MAFQQYTAPQYSQQEPIRAELPPYEPPPPWIPIEKRKGHPDYDNELRKYLPRSVKLTRQKLSDTLGFNIRAGQNRACGIFVSKVHPGAEAERVGLKEGDQILRANGQSFEDVEQMQAVRILKSDTDILLLVRYNPYGYWRTHDRETFMQATQAYTMRS